MIKISTFLDAEKAINRINNKICCTPPGESGVSGYSGSSGISGYSGYSGPSGYSGYSGANPGASGYSGYSGYSGANPGASGYSGYSGKSGYSGYSGSGISGYSGAGSSGYSGFSGAAGGSGGFFSPNQTSSGATAHDAANNTFAVSNTNAFTIDDGTFGSTNSNYTRLQTWNNSGNPYFRAQAGDASNNHGLFYTEAGYGIDIQYWSGATTNTSAFIGFDGASIQTNGATGNDYAGLFTSISGSNREAGLYARKDGTGSCEIDVDYNRIFFWTKNNSNAFIDTIMVIRDVPTYADDTAAGTAGLTKGRIYATSTGELRIKL